MQEQGNNQVCVPSLIDSYLYQIMANYLFLAGFVCDKALAATALVFALVWLLRSNEEALLATVRDVCFVFAFDIDIPPFTRALVSCCANSAAKKYLC